MIVATTLATLLISLILFYFLLIKKDRLTAKQWECIDYLWYGFGALALLLVVVELTRAHDIKKLEEEIAYAERAQYEIKRFVYEATPKACKKSEALCNMLADTLVAVDETVYSLDWPLGPVLFKKNEYRSWNEFLVDRADYYKAEGIPQFLLFHTTMLLELRSELRNRQQKLNKEYVPLWLRTVWPYILALVLSLRITKVTYKIRKTH